MDPQFDTKETGGQRIGVGVQPTGVRGGWGQEQFQERQDFN